MQGCRVLILFWIILSVLCTSGCRSYGTIRHPDHGTALDQMQDVLRESIAIDARLDRNMRYGAYRKNYRVNRIPSSVSKALLPYYASKRRCIPVRRFDISANEIPAKVFFSNLIEGTPYNIVLDPNVTGTITLNLKKVTIREALEALHDTYGYEFRRTTYGYEVLPAKISTKIFSINYLDVKRRGKSVTEVTSGQISEQVSSSTIGGSLASPTPVTTGGVQSITAGSTVDTRTEADFWKDITIALKEMVGDKDGRSVVVNSQSGVVIVNTFPPELRRVSRFLQRIQSNLERQVILEAKILEVQLNDQFQSGIDWNLIGKVIENNGGIAQTSLLQFPNTSLDDFHSIFTLRIKGDFGGLIKLLQTQGTVQVLSSPRISAINNQKAVIKVGTDQFFVTGVSTTNVTSGLSNNVFPTQNISLTPFFSGVTLDVTPQISRDGEVILHIHPTVSVVKDQTKTIVLGNAGGLTNAQNTYILPLAQSTIRESDNIVRAKNGQVIVIGGLMQNDMREEIASVPVLSKIPFLGFFFRRTQQLSQKIELVLLLRPLLTSNKVWIEQMKKASKTFDNMNHGFHAGGLPEVFGNEAECEA